MMRLADYLERNGRVSESGLWLRRAADAGHLPARVKLAQQRERVGRAGGERPWRQRVAASAPIARGAKKLFIGNLPYDATDEDLCEFFAQYGEVLSSAMVFDRATGRAKGFGFVEMPADAARIAISRGDGANFGNRVLTVSEARPEAETR
jgi:RNA recognition motif-containing protein